MKKFEQDFSLDHQMSLAGEGGGVRAVTRGKRLHSESSCLMVRWDPSHCTDGQTHLKTLPSHKFVLREVIKNKVKGFWSEAKAGTFGT